MKINILSPHIDDAAYSLALTISRCVNNQIPVTIINCFTVTKWAIRFVSKDVNEVSLLRKKEDSECYKTYNASIDIINLELTDAPLRNDYIFQSQPFQPDELKLVEIVKKKLEKSSDAILISPLGIGNHIDHAICKQAAVQLYRKMKVLFYEDLPYANRISETEIFDQIKILEERLNVQLTHRTDGLKNCTINKEQLIRLYKTQINDEICSEIMSHMNNLSGERIWGEAHLLEEFSRPLIHD